MPRFPANMADEYKFRAELDGHTNDVRCLDANENVIVSGSRDRSARIWSTKNYSLMKALDGHEGFVNAVLITESGHIVTGCQDKKIRIFNPPDYETFNVLEVHAATVSCLHSMGPFMASGSWDASVNFYENFNYITSFKGHAAAIWAVLVKIEGPAPIVLSGSADKSIRLWKNKKQERIYEGHSDVVRGLCWLAGNHFASSSNDTTVRIWDLINGQCLSILEGHTSFVYQVTLLPNGCLASCGEDGTVRIWQGNSLKQTILLPCITVWCLVAMENGDLAVGGSDAAIRIFSLKNFAPEAQLQAFLAASLAFHATQGEQKDVGGIPMDQLPGPDALLVPGTKDGQTKLIKTEKEIQVHQWSMEKGQWEFLGDYMETKKPELGKKMFMGKEYDYVFDVDTDSTQPSMKLPYNRNEDPWMAAQRFIHENDLPQGYLDQIAKFITQQVPNAGGNSATSGSSGNSVAKEFSGGDSFADPFTGGNRYVPQSESTTNGGFSDPFTGGARYVPQGHMEAPQLVNLATPPPDQPPYQFTELKPQPLIKAMTENNEAMDLALKLTDYQLAELKIFAECPANCSSDQLKALEKAMQWPAAKLVPILDLMRMALIVPKANAHFMSNARLLDRFATILTSSMNSAPLLICIGRCLANACAQESGLSLVKIHCEKLAELLIPGLKETKPAAQLAVASFFANSANVGGKINEISAENQQILVDFLLKAEKSDAKFRVILALKFFLEQSENLKNVLKTNSAFVSLLERMQNDVKFAGGMNMQMRAAEIYSLLL